MNVLEILLIGVGLAMDAFAVSICKGLSVSKLTWKHALIPAVYFGGFQGLMPLMGWLLGIQFQSLITSVDHWIAFFLLLFIGANMIREALGGDEGETNDSFSFLIMITLAVATSIDALAVGVTFAFLEVEIFAAISFIGIVTFVFSVLGIRIGNLFGIRFKSRAELAGGVILMGMGLKILLEHLGILG